MHLSHIKLLIVDMDNTLCDTFHTLSVAQWKHAANVLERKGYADHARVVRKNFGKYSFKKTLEDMNLSPAERKIAVAAYDDVNVRPLKLYSDAKAVFDIPIKKVLVTRGEVDLQLRKIKHLNIQRHFDDIYYIKTFESKKDAFRKILKKFKVPLKNTLVVGDRIEEEIKDANDMGMPSVLVRRPNWPIHRGVATPTLTVRSLFSLAKQLKTATRANR